jgi:alkylation response protein AidB-like acyl-CoA dehydrogenase
LANCTDFTTSLNKVLERTRLHTAWIGAGMMAGAFEAGFNHAMQRRAFGKPIAGF